MGYVTHIVYYEEWLTTQIKKFINSYDMSMWCSLDKCSIFKEDKDLIRKAEGDRKAFKITIYTKTFPEQFLNSVNAQFGKYSCIYSYKLPKMAYQSGMSKCSM